MSIFKKFGRASLPCLELTVTTIFLFSALNMAISGPAEAETTAKILSLSVGPSRIYLTDVPKLSLSNGPLVEADDSIRVSINLEAFSQFFENYKTVEQEIGFFRETRNFRDGQAKFIVKNVDGTVSETDFSLAPDATEVGVIEMSEFILDVDVAVTGKVDVYKCFDANSCVLEETRVEELHGERDASVFVKNNFRRLVTCYNDNRTIHIEASLDHPEIQRLVLNRTVAQDFVKVTYRSPISAKSIPVLNGAEFKGFTTEIGYFGLPYGEQDPGTTLEVIRENETLKIETRFPNGRFRSASGGRNCVNHP